MYLRLMIYISLRDENCDVTLCQLTYYDNDVWDIFQPNLINLAPNRNLINSLTIIGFNVTRIN